MSTVINVYVRSAVLGRVILKGGRARDEIGFFGRVNCRWRSVCRIRRVLSVLLLVVQEQSRIGSAFKVDWCRNWAERRAEGFWIAFWRLQTRSRRLWTLGLLVAIEMWGKIWKRLGIDGTKACARRCFQDFNITLQTRLWVAWHLWRLSGRDGNIRCAFGQESSCSASVRVTFHPKTYPFGCSIHGRDNICSNHFTYLHDSTGTKTPPYRWQCLWEVVSWWCLDKSWGERALRSRKLFTRNRLIAFTPWRQSRQNSCEDLSFATSGLLK